ncbi:MAG: helix-turn-helix domain-containing protein, partial [Bacteroidota bacterium]
YGNRQIDTEEALRLIQRLDDLMKTESLYKNPNIKLPEIAKRLHVLPHKLSQLINENLDKNFALFLNEYRIAMAKNMILQNENLKLESIGYECGFNSKSTFYATFKKLTGTTPSRFKDDKSH